MGFVLPFVLWPPAAVTSCLIDPVLIKALCFDNLPCLLPPLQGSCLQSDRYERPHKKTFFRSERRPLAATCRLLKNQLSTQNRAGADVIPAKVAIQGVSQGAWPAGLGGGGIGEVAANVRLFPRCSTVTLARKMSREGSLTLPAHCPLLISKNVPGFQLISLIACSSAVVKRKN